MFPLPHFRLFRRLALPVTLLALTLGLATAAEKRSTAKKEDHTGARAGDELFSSNMVPRLQIEIPEAGLAILRNYFWRNADRTNVLATVREGDVVYTNVTLHLKGAAGSFRSIDDKPALTLNFDKAAPGQRFHGLQKIHLNNSVQDPTYVSEQIARELFLKAGVPVPRAAHAVVELNERRLGLYVLLEGWNKQFLKRHFKDATGNLYDGGFAHDINEPLATNSGDRPDDRSLLDALVAATRDADPTNRLAKIEKTLAFDRFLTFAAMEVMLCHWDGYVMNRNNYRVYHDPAANRMVFLPHGLDQLWGTWRSTPESPITPVMKGLVARAVMTTHEGRRRYLERMAQLSTNFLDAATITNRVNEVYAQIRPLVLAHEGLPQAIYHQAAVLEMCDRITRRAASVREQLATPRPTAKLDEHGVVQLPPWHSSTEQGAASFLRKKSEDGKALLSIKARNTATVASWRSQALLEDGHYQFTGRLKVESLEPIPGDLRSGVTLRLSGDKPRAKVPRDADWTTLTHVFDIRGIVNTELVCDFRAANGEAIFDVDSLKLTRTGPPRPPKADASLVPNEE